MKMFTAGFSLFKRSFYVLHLFCNKYAKMSTESIVFVRLLEKEDTIKITFLYKYDIFPIQNFTFMRSKSELLESAITRMKSKIQSVVLQRSSRKKKAAINVTEEVLPPIDIMLVKNGMKVDEHTRNINAWTSDTEMIINNKSYKISVNPPVINQISLSKCIMSGFPVYPNITFEFCNKESAIFRWYRSMPRNDESSLESENDENVLKVKNDYWKLISEGFIYNTQQSDIGYKLRVSGIPQFNGKFGKEESAVSHNNVLPGPGKCPFEDRFKFTKEVTASGSLRFASYNILADLYADTETARNQLFPYCPADVLALDYRKQLYLKEIMGYNTDVLCLQEVDRSVFHNDLVPVLSTVGLKGVFNEKGAQVAEGLSCFYRDSKFKLVESHSIVLSEAIKTEAVLQRLYSKICENEKLTERFLSRTTVLQLTLLESIDIQKKRILVGNTHLYFYPDSDNIRLLQATCCLLYIEHILQVYRTQDTSYSISVVLCGDFNSCPEFGVYKLTTEGFLSNSCIDWKSNPEESVEGIDLSHTLQLNSACGTPQYTNFTLGFAGCLDYIFYDKCSLQVTEIVPFPSHEQVIEHVALPNKVFPSDHIALICTLKWNDIKI